MRSRTRSRRCRSPLSSAPRLRASRDGRCAVGSRTDTVPSRRRGARCLFAAILLLTGGAEAGADDHLFDVVSIASSGRTVMADLADMDGDGRSDIVSVAILGIPPEESRFLRVHFQGEDGSFDPIASRVLPLPSGAAAYDIGDISPEAGDELLLLRADGVVVLKVGRKSQSQRALPVPGATTLGAAADERGLERLELVRPGPDGGNRIWVPQLGEMTALSATGEALARIRTGGRANYFIPPRPGLVQNESDVQLFYDAARLSLGDMNGDGRQDAVTTTRHDLRIFLRREDGSLPTVADQQLPLRRMEFRDHIRGSGGVSSEVQDIDGDGRLDLMLSHVKGSLADATTRATIHMNRGGTFDLEHPDAEFVSESTLESNVLLDTDGDGHLELLRLGIAFSILEVIETLMSQEVDVELAIYRRDGDAPFGTKPWSRRKVEVGWSFDTFRPLGFIPTIFDDWNADGYTDFFSSGDGEAIEVYLGGPRNRYLKRNGRQELDTSGVVRVGDIDRDGLSDFVIHDPHTVDAPIRVGRNLGALPGTPPRLEVAGKEDGD